MLISQHLNCNIQTDALLCSVVTGTLTENFRLTTKNSNFWDITWETNRFSETYRLQFKVRRATQPRNVNEADSKAVDSSSSACCLLHARFLLGLLFETDDGGDMFFRSRRNILPDYMARDRNLRSHRCENLKCNLDSLVNSLWTLPTGSKCEAWPLKEYIMGMCIWRQYNTNKQGFSRNS
jgi:hypothetical protein